jgi:Ca2+-binding RTX toxin-like protein
MPTILDYYEYAKLATAAYVAMDKYGGTFTGADFAMQADYDDVSKSSRIPIALANQMFDKDSKEAKVSGQPVWTVRPDGYHGNDASGFAATLFERTKDGATQKVLAIRGTEPIADWGIDLIQADLAGIGILGLALNQAVEMVNYLRLLGTPTDQGVDRLQLHASLTVPSVPSVQAPGKLPGQSVYFYFTTERVNGLGLIGAGEKIAVTGHSLGGHLAALAARLFPSLVSEAYTYNAPGFDPASVQVAGAIPGAGAITNAGLIAALAGGIGPAVLGLSSGSLKLTEAFVGLLDRYLGYGAASSFAEVASRTYTIESENLAPGNDASAVAGVFTNAQSLPPETFITTERNSHLIEPMMDSLAMQALLYRLNSDLTLTQITALYEGASPQIGDTLEKLTAALHKAIVGTSPTLTTVDIDELGTMWSMDAGNIDGRREYHAAVQAIEGKLAATVGLRLHSLIGKSADAMVGAAKDATPEGLATRYALKELNPFAILGVDYSTHNSGGKLDLYDKASGAGELTDAWLTDRAAMLTWKLKLAAADKTSSHAFPYPNNQRAFFDDRASGEQIYLDSAALPTQRPYYVFGSDAAESDLEGGSLADHLYGGGGDDELKGNGGADYLEGNAGIDTLEGGAGADTLFGGRGNDLLKGGADADTYIINSGDGHDHIEDGGRNYIKYNGRLIAGSFIQATPGGAYTFLGQQDGQPWTMQFHSPGVLSLDDDTSITFDNYTSAEAFEEAGYGIALIDAPAPVDTSRVIQGDRQWQVFHAAAELVDGTSPLPTGGPMFPGAEWTVTVNHPVNPQNPTWANWRIDQGEGVLIATYYDFGWTVKEYRIVSATWAYNQIDDLGNYLTTDEVVFAGERLYGSEGNDRILAGEGGDEVQARGGDDRIELGAGDDHAEGGDGNDILIGGTGVDRLFGQGGDDILYANAEVDPAAARIAGDNQAFDAAESGWLDGGDGERARIWIDNKSQSAQHGAKHTANDNEWRIAA